LKPSWHPQVLHGASSLVELLPVAAACEPLLLAAHRECCLQLQQLGKPELRLRGIAGLPGLCEWVAAVPLAALEAEFGEEAAGAVAAVAQGK
jgi:hypothetical protein